jgi:hypothetical protein
MNFFVFIFAFIVHLCVFFCPPRLQFAFLQTSSRIVLGQFPKNRVCAIPILLASSGGNRTWFKLDSYLNESRNWEKEILTKYTPIPFNVSFLNYSRTMFLLMNRTWSKHSMRRNLLLTQSIYIYLRALFGQTNTKIRGLKLLFFLISAKRNRGRFWIDSLTFESSLLALPQKSTKESIHQESSPGIDPTANTNLDCVLLSELNEVSDSGETNP